MRLSSRGLSMPGLIDSGSSKTIISEQDVYDNKWNMEKQNLNLLGFAGGKCESIGTITGVVEIDGIKANVMLVVVKNQIKKGM